MLVTSQDLEVGFFPLTVILQAFVLQVLSADKSCRQTLCRVLIDRLKQTLQASSLNTSNYVRARQRLPEQLVHEVREKIALHEQAQTSHLWQERHVYIIDGTTILLPDTEANQSVWPQHRGQKPGIGFPILKLTALMSLATGCVAQYAIGPIRGCSELELGRKFFQHLKPKDVIVGDRIWDNFWFWHEVQRLDLDGVARVTTRRKWRKKKKLGHNDYLVKINGQKWSQLHSRRWNITHEEYDKLPKELELRLVKIQVKRPGFRIKTLQVLTTLMKPSAEEIADLYLQRWNIELDLRNIKTTMKMDRLSCKTPDMIRKELAVHWLAYNLIRKLQAECGAMGLQGPRDISYKACLQIYACLMHAILPKRLIDSSIYIEILIELCKQRVRTRPNRNEPRVVKARPKQQLRMTKPRSNYKI